MTKAQEQFFREKAWRQAEDYKPPSGVKLTKGGVIARGWTRTAIDRILGKADVVQHNERNSGRPVLLFDGQRVAEAEKNGPTRYRRAARASDFSNRLDEGELAAIMRKKGVTARRVLSLLIEEEADYPDPRPSECESCGCTLSQQRTTGRPRKFCSDRCRVRAMRERRAAAKVSI